MLYFPIKRIVKIGSYLYKCQYKYQYSVSSLCLKSSIVGADMALAGRLFQRRAADEKKDHLYALIEQYGTRNRC